MHSFKRLEGSELYAEHRAENMKRTLSQLALRWLPVLAPWAVLGVGLAATAGLAISTHREMMERDREQFEHETLQLIAGVESHLRRYAQALMGMREWFFTHYECDMQAFLRHHLQTNTPSVTFALYASTHYTPSEVAAARFKTEKSQLT